jgi:hypothetical protein
LDRFVCARLKIDREGGAFTGENASLAATCKVTGLPAVAVLGTDGKLLAHETGPDREDLENFFGKFMTSK